MPICFVVNVLPGEPEFLTAISHETLRVANENGEIIFSTPAPEFGWTQASLEKVTEELLEYPLDVYLGSEWVGSTEV